MSTTKKTNPRRITSGGKSAGHSASAKAGKPAGNPVPAIGDGTRTVLIATTGMTPAVLTETVWALAHASDKTKRAIPDEIIAITTIKGAAALRGQLFGDDEIWKELRAAILGKNAGADPRLKFHPTPAHIKVAERDGAQLDGLSDTADHTAFADAITHELYSYTSRPDTRVIASLAGGFKTMSALMLSAMQLLAAPGDRVTHVLASGGLDKDPAFFFPRNKKEAAHIQLIDIPLIPLRRWFADILGSKPPTYADLISKSAEYLTSRGGDIMLEIGPVVPGKSNKDKHHILLNSVRYEITAGQFALLRFFAEQKQPFERSADAVEEFQSWLNRTKETAPQFYSIYESVSGEKPVRGEKERKAWTVDTLSKRLSDLREYIKTLQPGGKSLADALPCKGAWHLNLPPENIKLLD